MRKAVAAALVVLQFAGCKPVESPPDGGADGGAPAPGVVRGVLVFDGAASREPAAGAHLQFTGTTLAAVSSAEGAFVFPDVPAGTFVLIAAFEAPQGLLQLQRAVTVPPPAADRAAVDLGTLVLQSGGALTGRVTLRGTPLAGARVAALGFASTTSGTDGRYELVLPRGPHRVVAVFTDGVTSRVSAPAAVALDAAATLDFALTGDEPDSGPIAGTAQRDDAAAGGHGGVHIQLQPSGGGSAIEVGETAADGSFAATAPADLYVLRALSESGSSAFVSPAAPGTASYFLTVTVTGDCDRDGVVDSADADDDNDGIADGEEAAACVCEPSGSADADHDGLCDSVEDRTVAAAPRDTIPPQIAAVSPADDAAGVSVDAVVEAIFSEPMDADSIGLTTFALTPATAATVGYQASLRTATLTPLAPLQHATTYVAFVDRAVFDLAGNALAASFTWSFTTAAAPDHTAPEVLSTVPAAATADVSPATDVSVTFTEPMDAATLDATTFTLSEGTSGAVSYDADARTATFHPDADLLPATAYTATVTTGAKDLAGNALAADYPWTFTTAASPDTTPPAIVSTTPAANATGAEPADGITIVFSEPMDTASVAAAIGVDDPGFGDPFPAEISTSTDGTTAVVQGPFVHETVYTATVTTGAKDLAGNALAADHVWTFTTRARRFRDAARLHHTANPGAPAAAAAGNGDLFVTWLDSDAGKDRIWAARFARSARAWQPAVQIGAPQSLAAAPRVGADASGNAVVGWEQLDATGNSVYAARWDAVQASWSVAAPVEAFDNSSGDFDLSLSSTGHGALAWVQRDGTKDNIWVARVDPAGTWSAPERIDDPNTTDYHPLAATFAQLAMVAWIRESAPGQWSLYASRWDASSWSTPAEAENVPEPIGYPALAYDGASAIALWTKVQDSLPTRLYATRYTAAGGWEPAVAIDNGAAPVMFPFRAGVYRVGVLSDAVAAWKQGSPARLYTSYLGPDELAWSAPVRVDASGQYGVNETSLAVGYRYPRQTAYAWTEVDAGATTYDAYFSPGPGYPILPLEAGAGLSLSPALAVDWDGNTVAAWVQGDGLGEYDFWGRVFD